MLPGSFVERRRKCGKPNCRCAKKEHEFHLQFQLSVLWKGKPYAFHIPAEMAKKLHFELYKMHSTGTDNELILLFGAEVLSQEADKLSLAI